MNGISFKAGGLMMKNVLFAGCLCVLAQPVLAQEASAGEEEAGDVILLGHKLRDDFQTILVTGNRQRLDQSGQSISVINAAEIAAVQGPDLVRVFERVPGITLSRNGGLGGFTALRVRGSGSEQVLVMLDNVRIADVAAPGGGTDLGTVMAGGLGMIEVLRGANSVAWGSEAIGGVVAMTSREVDGVEASAEYGARQSLDAQALAGIARDGHALSISGGYTRTDGISSAAVGSEADPFRQWRVGGKGRLQLGEQFRLTATARYANSKLDIDGFPAPLYQFGDTAEFQETRQFSGRAGIGGDLGRLTLDAGYALSDTRRDYFDPAFGDDPSFATKGSSQRAELRGQYRITDAWLIDFGTDHEWSRFSTTFDPRKSARLASGHALLGWHGDRLHLTAGARIDDHSRFGSKATFGANGSFDIAGDWRLRASWGEGFKVPTLYQLFSNYGNVALLPETSTSFDIGVEKGDRNAALHFAATAFRRDSRNLIDFVSCFGRSTGICVGRPFGTYDNVGKARAQGFELELGARISERFRAQAAYSHVKAVNRTPGAFDQGKDLPRRPRHAVALSADWQTPLAEMTLGGDMRLVSDSRDFTPIDGHTLLTVRAAMPLGERLELFGRIENLGDVKYREVDGYGTPGRSAFVGARARF